MSVTALMIYSNYTRLSWLLLPTARHGLVLKQVKDRAVIVPRQVVSCSTETRCQRALLLTTRHLTSASIRCLFH